MGNYIFHHCVAAAREKWKRRKKVNEVSAHVTHPGLKENTASVHRRMHFLTQESALLPISENYSVELRNTLLSSPLH